MSELQTGQARPAPTPLARPSAPIVAPTAAALPRTPAPGSMAPDPATAAPPTLAPTAPPPSPAPTVGAPPPLALPTARALSNEERWRSQQQGRQIFEGSRSFETAGSQLWWYDPVNQQHVILGIITGPFVAQAQFQPSGQGVEALEVPYQVNVSYGLTALSPAIVERITAAGYASDWIETYVFLTPDITQR